MSFRRFLAGAALAALGIAPAAAGHVTANPGEAQAGFGYTQFRVGHGCEGTPTIRLRLQIPAGVASVKAEVVPGWDVEYTQGELEQPVNIHGEEVTEGVTEITWEGGSLPDDRLQHFGVSFYASEELAGETVYWPIVQECEEGEHRWITIPVEGEEEPPAPAPGIAFLAAAEDETASNAEAAADGGSEGGEAAAASGDAGGGDDGDGMATVALILGIAGLVAGLAALGVALSRSRRTDGEVRTA